MALWLRPGLLGICRRSGIDVGDPSPALPPTLLPASDLALALCNFLSRSLACISCNLSWSVSSSSSSSSSLAPWMPSPMPADRDGLALKRPPREGDGLGDVWFSISRYRSLPFGVLRRASCGDLGGHCWSASLPAEGCQCRTRAVGWKRQRSAYLEPCFSAPVCPGRGSRCQSGIRAALR